MLISNVPSLTFHLDPGISFVKNDQKRLSDHRNGFD